MSRQYTHVQGLLPSVIAMKEKGYTYRQIADQFGMEKEQIEELCSRERRKQRSELDQIIIEYDVFLQRPSGVLPENVEIVGIGIDFCLSGLVRLPQNPLVHKDRHHF